VPFLLAVAAAGLLLQQPETMSLVKEPLYPPSVPRAERAQLEAQIAQARGEIGRDPANADAVLRMARAQRGLGHVGDALETLTRAIERKTDTPAIRLERGRGFLLIRKFDLAQREFRKAAEALPEAHCDIAFALYLLADYPQAHAEYGKCAQPGFMGYLAARRAGVDAGAIPPLPSESGSTRAPVKLPGSVSTGKTAPDASLAAVYAKAVDRLIAGDRNGARELLKPVVEKKQDEWMEPIYIAAEADYARVFKPERKKKKKT
jgi:tetratricopeptide (TPR) repeat protein